MRSFPYPLLFALALTGDVLLGQDQTSRSTGERIARFLNPAIRKADARLATLTRELESLPRLYTGPRGSRYGFRSDNITSQIDPHWLQLDLQNSRELDAVVLVPAYVPPLGVQGEGYGFPLRFRIEVSDSPDMADSQIVVDQTAADFEHPARYPVVFETNGAAGRHLRITSTKHLRGKDGYYWALEEVMVLAGQSNVAVGRPQTASSRLELFPNWSLLRVNDGLSRVGYPWTLEPSPTEGFLSDASPSSDAQKWLAVDLQKPFPIDEIRLIPTNSDYPAVVGGRGFPTDLTLELADDPEFATILWSSSAVKVPLGFPWHAPLIRYAQGTTARYLRVRTNELFARGDQHSFALAEIQAYSDGVNVALGKPVQVSDRSPRADAQRWAPEFAVDGFASDYRLAEYPSYLAQLVDRREREKERQSLRRRREEMIEVTSAAVTAGLGSLGVVAVSGWLWMLVRQRTVRRRDAERLREQIARDLHDDIGSNLGGIVLLSEAGSLHAEANPEIQKDFAEIKETAEQTAEAMRDIVWLIEAGKSDLHGLFVKMRESVEAILGDLQTTVEIEPPAFRNRSMSLAMRRHFFFAFKESLNNVRKHAHATRVDIRITVTPRQIIFRITDDGRGFQTGEAGGSGHGLENLERRAEQVCGECKIESKPGRGTSVTFSASLQK